jgi:D-serine deaminase-like pyridoxal phosphate-dependent protein
MGTNYTYMEDFRIAAKVLCTVISRPDSRTAIGDAGLLALAGPGGALPSVEGLPDVSIAAVGDTTTTLRSDGPMPLALSAQFLLLSGQQDIMVNRWDQYVAVRNGVVEAVWEIPARGCHQ